MKLKNVEDIPQNWKRLTVRKKSTVKIRPSMGIERFKVSWSDSELISDPEKDLIVISDKGSEYPHKIDIFFDVYEHVPKPAGGAKSWDIWDYEYKKKVTNVIVEIPEDVKPFEVETLEGVVGGVSYPDYVAIGAKGELYVNTRDFVENELVVVMKPMKYGSSLYDSLIDLTNKRMYFWNGVFSQWYRHDYYDPEVGQTFCCAEQSMMYYKAMTFEDRVSMAKIMKEKNPRNQKALGRLIKGYDQETWDKVKFDIVKRNNILKFSNNDILTELIILTDGFELVEASPYDTIWGIGISKDDPDVFDKSKWKGENLLGLALVEARKHIINTL